MKCPLCRNGDIRAPMLIDKPYDTFECDFCTYSTTSLSELFQDLKKQILQELKEETSNETTKF